MAKAVTPHLLQGTLDLLILHALQRGPMHGYAIAQAIHLLSDEVLKVEEGSLYPALYRLELDGAISAEWGASENNRKAKYYQVTKRGRKLLAGQQKTWTRLSAAVTAPRRTTSAPISRPRHSATSRYTGMRPSLFGSGIPRRVSPAGLSMIG